jgi:hypothetical protein
MSRQRQISLTESQSHAPLDDYLLVHIYKDVRLDMWAARMRYGDHVLDVRPHSYTLRTMQDAASYARTVIQQLNLSGEVRWQYGERPVVDSSAPVPQ